jgi:SAM-dependent methyltransferase
LKQRRSISPAYLLKGADLEAVCADVEAYYAAKLARHGETPLGVDWSCTATQWLRFVQLLRVCPSDGPLSLIDLGCGYGALATFLAQQRRGANFEYLGIDLSTEMVRRARRRHRGDARIRFVAGRSTSQSADYVVASGIMNVMLDLPLPTWEKFVRTMLVNMDRMSKSGFAVNFATKPGSLSRPEQLYCTTPEKWALFCERELDRSAEILDGYGLQEFTLLVRTPKRQSSRDTRSKFRMSRPRIPEWPS